MPSIKKIKTTSGLVSIDYTGIEGAPILDTTLSLAGGVAEAEATGKAVDAVAAVKRFSNKSSYKTKTVQGNAIVVKIEGKSQQDTFPAVNIPEHIRSVGENGGITITCSTSDDFISKIIFPVILNGIKDIKDELRLLMPGESYLNMTGKIITITKPTMVLFRYLDTIAYDGSEGWEALGNCVYRIELPTAKRDYAPVPKNIISTNFLSTDNMPYDLIANGTCTLLNGGIDIEPGTNWLYVRCDSYNTIESFKNYLSNYPMTLLYPLAYPYAEEIKFNSSLFTPFGECIISTTDSLLSAFDIDVPYSAAGAYILNNLVDKL